MLLLVENMKWPWIHHQYNQYNQQQQWQQQRHSGAEASQQLSPEMVEWQTSGRGASVR